MVVLNKYTIGGILLTVLSIALFSIDISKGNASVGIFFIIPYIFGGGIFSFCGALSLMGAFFLFFIGFIGFSTDSSWEDNTIESTEPNATHQKRSAQLQKKYGGVILIGPFPVIFGSDRNGILIAVGLSVVFLIITFVVLVYILKFWG